MLPRRAVLKIENLLAQCIPQDNRLASVVETPGIDPSDTGSRSVTRAKRVQILHKHHTLSYGMSEPVQATINPNASYFREEWSTKYATYDVDQANALLDEMGLEWDADHVWRLRPDGERLSSIYLYFPEFTVEHLELVRGYWAAVGHELIITEVARALRDERGRAADHDVTGWNVDLAEEIACYLPYATNFQQNLEMYYSVN